MEGLFPELVILKIRSYLRRLIAQEKRGLHDEFHREFFIPDNHYGDVRFFKLIRMNFRSCDDVRFFKLIRMNFRSCGMGNFPINRAIHRINRGIHYWPNASQSNHHYILPNRYFYTIGDDRPDPVRVSPNNLVKIGNTVYEKSFASI